MEPCTILVKKRPVSLMTSCPSQSLPIQVTVAPIGTTILLGQYSILLTQTSFGPGPGFIGVATSVVGGGAGVSCAESGVGVIGTSAGVGGSGVGVVTTGAGVAKGVGTRLVQAPRITNTPIRSGIEIIRVIRILSLIPLQLNRLATWPAHSCPDFVSIKEQVYITFIIL